MKAWMLLILVGLVSGCQTSSEEVRSSVSYSPKDFQKIEGLKVEVTVTSKW